MNSPADRGFVYVATGTGYLEEALRSAESLKRFNPHFPVCLVTDRTESRPAIFDEIIIRSDVERNPCDKLLAVSCPWKRAVFLDTDTRIFGDITGLFEILDRFDLAALPETKRGWDYSLPGIPLTFSELNTGVIAFRKSEATQKFFADWQERYRRLNETMGLINDQPAFREALWHSDLRFAPIPSEFHFLGNVPNYIMWKANVIHARGDLEAIGASVNREPGPRTFVPEIGTISGFTGKRHWLRQMAKIIPAMARLLFVPPVDSAGMNPRKWWKDERRGPD